MHRIENYNTDIWNYCKEEKTLEYLCYIAREMKQREDNYDDCVGIEDPLCYS